MYSAKIETYQYLKEFPRIHVKITDTFFEKIKSLLRLKYGSLYEYHKTINIQYVTLKKEFRKNAHHPFHRLNRYIGDVEISEKGLFDNILGFYHWGSHREFVMIPRIINADEFFVEGYALYLAEGNNGSNGLKRPRGFVFTNSEISVMNYMIAWIQKYFPKLEYSIVIVKPRGTDVNIETIKKKFDSKKFVYAEESYNKIVKYKLCCYRAVLIDLILSLDNKIKDFCSQDRKIACAYIRGMMIGEGTVYNNRSRYVRIEMRNRKEIEHIHKLFIMLGYDCKISCRTTREDMWSIYIGAGQLKKFHDEIGFGVHEKRQRILIDAIS